MSKSEYTLKQYLSLEKLRIKEEVGDVVVLEDLTLENTTYTLTKQDLQNRYEWWLRCWDFTINFEYLNYETPEDKEMFRIDWA